ncbi:MAG: DUF547 domain-containing protein [Porticoccaceae bacterium]|nr:DUF547 domain-containing protein [Porticoccaceae bacterium]MBT5577421.1 DUF547 domain-containing protein [Porticoccaceae bacterium]
MGFDRLPLLIFCMLWSLGFSSEALAGKASKYWSLWDKSNEQQRQSIDHGDFDQLLAEYVIVDHPSGINRFRYALVKQSASKQLSGYIKKMARLDPRDYSRDEQKAYWLNLYNALTIQELLKVYPVKSVPQKRFKRKKLVRIAGVKLSLDDIENRILRPIWQDPKLLFGLSCASLGCPNIHNRAFTAKNSKALLTKSVTEFINHPRGLEVSHQRLRASALFDWYATDFGSDRRLLRFLANYADDHKALYVLGFKGEIRYQYDNRINAPSNSWPL